VASTGLRSHLSTLVRLIAEIQQYKDVPKALPKPSQALPRTLWPERSSLICEKFSLRGWVIDWRKQMLSSMVSEYDRRLLRRL
jgi:hypothetical protein